MFSPMKTGILVLLSLVIFCCNSVNTDGEAVHVSARGLQASGPSIPPTLVPTLAPSVAPTPTPTLVPTSTPTIAPVPNGWTCSGESFRDEVCDCECGIPDPACEAIPLTSSCGLFGMFQCSAQGTCEPNKHAKIVFASFGTLDTGRQYFQFLTFTDLAPLEVIHFTNNDVFANGTMFFGDGIISWQPPLLASGPLPGGSLIFIDIDENGTATADIGTVISQENSFFFKTFPTGDSLTAFETPNDRFNPVSENRTYLGEFLFSESNREIPDELLPATIFTLDFGGYVPSAALDPTLIAEPGFNVTQALFFSRMFNNFPYFTSPSSEQGPEQLKLSRDFIFLKVPDTWTCDPDLYGAGGIEEVPLCNCGCGDIDPDCIPSTFVDQEGPFVAYQDDCPNGLLCHNKLSICVDPLVNETAPPTWFCEKGFFNSRDGCDCSCGAHDPDCDFFDRGFQDLFCGGFSVDGVPTICVDDICNTTTGGECPVNSTLGILLPLA